MSRRRGELGAWSLSSRVPFSSATARTFTWLPSEVLQLQRDLGALAVLPLEATHQILSQLPMAALARLQRVSAGMRRAVGTVPRLRALLRHAPDTVRAVAATRAGRYITCDELHAAMCDPGCRACGRPGAYLYLLACHRVCYNCLVERERYRPLRPRQASALFGGRMADVAALRKVVVPRYRAHAARRRSRPGPRPPNTTGWRLVDRVDARDVGLREHGSAERVRDAVAAGRAALHRLPHSRGARLMRGAYTPPGVEASLSAAVQMPWFHRGEGRTAYAVLCEACRREMRARGERRGWYFTEEGYREHERVRGVVVKRRHVKEGEA